MSARSHLDKLCGVIYLFAVSPTVAKLGVHHIRSLGSILHCHLWGQEPSSMAQAGLPQQLGPFITPWWVAALCVESSIPSMPLEKSFQKQISTSDSHYEYICG